MAAPLYLSEEDHKRVSEAVARAESGTSGEIVTILADRSDGYTDVALAWAAFATLAALAALAFAPDFFLALWDGALGGWSVNEWTPRAVLVAAAAIATLKFAGVMLIQLWQPLKFWLIPPPIKTARVHDRAVRAFRIGAERRTHGRTGILIYLSMRERRAEIVADEAIAGSVDPDVWGEAMEHLLRHAREGHFAHAMVAAVDRVGLVLKDHFPAVIPDENELPDRLIEV
ncbi:membrane protein [Novosphingobium marinum]|uniref:Putative membrane protein n=1 Tax=Novosphingobium marinum TaxID=1514948 RepID=A0A7Z0BTY5_9SPHN|nr:hypothetical protein [Novosphingobium marinum]NYH96516.1 putative membrane protein [Novosphingobium marinum]GGC35821.1 membrane protein [Novosphingobium marinum]